MLLRVGNNGIAGNRVWLFSAMLLRVGNDSIAEKLDSPSLPKLSYHVVTRSWEHQWRSFHSS